MPTNFKRKAGICAVFLLSTFCIFTLHCIRYITTKNGMVAFSGVTVAAQFAFCILCLLASPSKGCMLALAVQTIIMADHLWLVFVKHYFSAAPGVANSILYITTIIIMARSLKKKEEESSTDPLTGLMNRRALFSKVQALMDSGRKFDIIYVNIANIRIMNNTYGHKYGDKLKQVVAQRMSEEAGKEANVAYFGGVEFVIVTKNGGNTKNLAERIVANVSEKISMDINGAEIDFYPEIKAGISSFPKDADNPEELVRCADIAMYASLRAKSPDPLEFVEEMGTELHKKLSVNRLIHKGLEKDWFFMVYQPQFTAEGKKLRGFESLVRLRTDEGVSVSPGDFIPVAETSNLIIDIDDCVTKKVMEDMKDVVEKNTGLTVSINVSSKNIAHRNFPAKIRRFLSQTGFPAKNLEIEITEYCLAESMETVIANMNELKAEGIQFALDDFGTGYTSLSYLATLPANLLKIDKSLVDEIVNDEKRLSFAGTVISIGHLMNCEVISEGVETEMQLELLKEKGCDFVQGFIWGRPMEVQDAKRLALEKE